MDEFSTLCTSLKSAKFWAPRIASHRPKDKKPYIYLVDSYKYPFIIESVNIWLTTNYGLTCKIVSDICENNQRFLEIEVYDISHEFIRLSTEKEKANLDYRSFDVDIIAKTLNNATKSLSEKKDKEIFEYINNSLKIIFLDIDGVLNGYNKFTGFMFKIFTKLHLMKFVNTRYDLYGIRKSMVKRLSKICKLTDAKIVLTSSWRDGWYENYRSKSGRERQLQDYFEEYGIYVVGITNHIYRENYSRGIEIKSWLSLHKVKSFVILDDEDIGISDLYSDNFIKTSNATYITGAWYENTGLKSHHVKQAIKILNK